MDGALSPGLNRKSPITVTAVTVTLCPEQPAGPDRRQKPGKYVTLEILGIIYYYIQAVLNRCPKALACEECKVDVLLLHP